MFLIFTDLFLHYLWWIYLNVFFFPLLLRWFYCFLNTLYYHCGKDDIIRNLSGTVSRCLPDLKEKKYIYEINIIARFKKLSFYLLIRK